MHQKIYSILFCGLLASSFVHEFKVKAESYHAFPIVKRAVTEEPPSEIVCENSTSIAVTGNITLSIIPFAAANLLAIVNVTSNATVIIDITANLVALVNVSTGEAVVINITANVLLYITNGVLGENLSLQAFVYSLVNGLTPLLTNTTGTSFDLATAPAAILKVINGIVGGLTLNISDLLQVRIKLGLQIILVIVKQLINLLKGPLNGYLALYVCVNVTIADDLIGFYLFTQGLATILGQIPGGLTAQITAGVKYVLEILVKKTSGLERLIVILETINVKIDLGSTLVDTLNDIESVFKLISLLGGNVLTGVAGLYRVIAKLIAFVNGKISLEVVIQVTLQFLAANNQTVRKQIPSLLYTILNDLKQAINGTKNPQLLSGYVAHINDYLNGTFIYAGVNISAIVELLTGGDNPLQIVVSILLRLKTAVELNISIPTLLLVLLVNLNISVGVDILLRLGIIKVLGGLLSTILKLVLALLRRLIGNLYDLLRSIPVVKGILSLLSNTLSELSNGEVNLREILSAKTDIVLQIKGLLQISSGIDLGIGVDIIVKVNATIIVLLITRLGLNVDIGIELGIE